MRWSFSRLRPLLLALTARRTRPVESAGGAALVDVGSSSSTVRLPSPIEWPAHRGAEAETRRVVDPRRRDGGPSAASRRP
jgi:hypothetical protein